MRKLGAALAEARRRTDELFEIVHPEAYYERPIPERNRIVFYLGHLEAFDWNLISRHALDAPAFHPQFDRLFAFGIDPELGDVPSDRPSDWPKVNEIRAYNREVRDRIDRLLEKAPEQMLHVAIEHRLMHAETFAYMMHRLPHSQKAGAAAAPQDRRPAPVNPMRDIPAGVATLGQPRNGDFGWDNEFGEHRVATPAFRISKYKVTNGEYLEFVRDGCQPPGFWVERSGSWHYRGMFAEYPLPLDAPVYVTYQEASDFARWKGLSLPTEAEFHRAAYGTPDGHEGDYPWGGGPARERGGSNDFRCWDPVAVDSAPGDESAFGVAQMAGNGWEWTSSEFGPFPGFEPFSFYPGYSRDFFDGRHLVVKGGSMRTAARLLRRSFRNWFRGDYPYAYTGFRLVER